MTNSIADVLDKAADLIEPEGAWLGGTCTAGCYCAWSAILAVTGKKGSDADATVPGVLLFAKLVGASNSHGIWRWNDAPERTQAEVVAKLREAAQLARTQSAEAK